MDFMAAAKEICLGSAVGAVLGACLVAAGYKLKPLWDKVVATFSKPAIEPFRDIKTVPLPSWVAQDMLDTVSSAPHDNDLFPGIQKVRLPSYKDLKKKPPAPP